MSEETWNPVVGYEGLYEVSDQGRVRAIFESWNGRYKPGRVLAPLNHPNGYYFVNLYYPGSKQLGRAKTIHSIVLESFGGPRPKGNDCCHIDGNKRNNSRCNLRWGTRRENVQDSINHGTCAFGEDVHFAKLKKESVIRIREMFDGGVICKDIAKQFNISIPQANRIGNRKSWKQLK